MNLFAEVVWALMTLLSLFAGLYIIANTIKDYFKFDVLTQTTRINSDSISLPSVALCTWNTKLKEIIGNAVLFDLDRNSVANLTGEGFTSYNEYLDNYYCMKFNNYNAKNQDLYFVNEIDPTSYLFVFYINVNVNAIFDMHISDNYLNILDPTQYVSGFTTEEKGYIY